MRPPVRMSSDHESLGALMSVVCPISSDHDDAEEYGGDMAARGFSSGNKRRLSVEQVKALEKNFEVENKLEPERKLKLAHDLALQPRQVAVWFQNRRARWKTKNLERDYAILKASFDSLHRDFDSLRRENHSLLSQVKELKSKLENDDEEEENEDSDANPENPVVPTAVESLCAALNSPIPTIPGDSSDDSSAVLNDDSNTAVLAANDMSSSASTVGERLVKIEEHNFLTGDETCDDFFSDEQPPSLPWYCSGADEDEHQTWMFL